MLSDDEFRHGLLDPQVEKHRELGYARGVYVDVASLLGALRERGYVVTEDDVDGHVRSIGGQRLAPASGLARLFSWRKAGRSARYFLPEPVFQRIRQHG